MMRLDKMLAKVTGGAVPNLPSLTLAITEHAPLPMATVDGATHIVRYGNPAFCRLLKKPLRSLIGKPLSTLLPKKDHCVTLLDRVYRNRKAEIFTEKENTKHHPVFWSYTMWPVLEDKGLVGVMIQVTETTVVHETTIAMNEALMMGSVRQHQLTEAAENANAKLHLEISLKERIALELAEKARLLDLSHDAIIVRDMKGYIRYWNHGAEELYGWTRAQAMGKISNVLLKTRYPVPLKLMTEELFRTNRWTGELEHTKRNGTQITVLARKTLDRDLQGRPAAVLENITDITERKEAEVARRRLDLLTVSNLELESEILRQRTMEEIRRQNELHQSQLLEQSNRMQEQMRWLSRQVLVAQEDERKEISRELHDVIAQTLTGINIRLAALKKVATIDTSGLEKNIDQTQRLVEKSVDIIHQFARELRPAVLDDLGLIPALHTFLKDFSARTGVHVEMTASNKVEQLDISHRTALFRVAQEALTNVARHAKASRVEVSLQQVENSIVLRIKDNGKSFKVERAFDGSGKRLGLLGMRERVEMVGGIFAIESGSGQGTTVRVEIPLVKTREKKPKKVSPPPR